MKSQFRRAYRAFRALGSSPNWGEFDAHTRMCSLSALVAAGKVRCEVLKGGAA